MRRMQNPKKTSRITTNYYLHPTEDQLQNEEVEDVVEEVHVVQDDQTQDDHFQNDDQDVGVDVDASYMLVKKSSNL